MWPFRRKKSLDEIAADIDGGGRARAAGQVVTSRTALQVSTVLACVDVIATGCAVPDLHLMRDLGQGQKERATEDRRYRLLNRRPNDWQTSMELRETMTMHCALLGEAFALPVRDIRTGDVREIIPLAPGTVSIRQPNPYEIVYDVHDGFGPVGVFRPDQLLHLRNRSWDRLRGMSVVSAAASAIGLSMAAEQNVSLLYENGGRPGGILTTEETLSQETVDRVKTSWERVSNGPGRYRTALLDKGLKYQSMGMSAIDQQVLETRRMQVEEVCRAFGVFPQMVGHSDKTATFASAEAFFSAHNRITVRKWQKMWAQKLDEFVLDGAGPLFVEFDNRDMLAASVKDQGEFFAKALGTGGGVPFMTVNEVRAERGLPPIEGGDALREPAASTVAPPQNEESDDEDAGDA